jgi:hypothetical protein
MQDHTNFSLAANYILIEMGISHNDRKKERSIGDRYRMDIESIQDDHRLEANHTISHIRKDHINHG